MSNNFIVYKHTSPSGKIYVGITGQDPVRRWRGGLGYRHNTLFFHAILKYGWDNFRHEILFSDLTRAEACLKEVELIAKYKSNERAHGYNLTEGGEGNHGAERSEAYRKSQSEKTRALWADSEYRAHMSSVHKGKKQSRETIDRRRESYLLGHPVSEKTRQTARERLRGNMNRARKVVCVETGAAFQSIKDAAQWAGVAAQNINRQLHGGRKSAGGYHWEYLEEETHGSIW